MKVLLIGSNGRMGRCFFSLLQKQNHECLGIDKESRFLACAFSPDVIVDFSSSACLESNLALAKQKCAPIVIATTNHSPENLDLIKEHSKFLPVFMASNFSELFARLMKILPELCTLSGCDFVLSEIHHKNKKDSPSGSMKDMISVLKQRGIEPIVQCLRLQEVVGRHKIAIYSKNERLEITHEVQSREAFCDGALKACEFIITKRSGLFTMQDL